MTELHSLIVEQAMRLATRAHRHQRRKSSDLPYIAHPASVALILQRSGFDAPNIIAAALLHDVVEDTAITSDEIQAAFPGEVSDWVLALSEQKLDESGQQRPWIDRKQEHLDHIASAPLEARAILLADKLHNLISMQVDIESGADVWARFGAPRSKVLWYYLEITTAAAQSEPQLQGLASECQQRIATLEQPTAAP